MWVKLLKLDENQLVTTFPVGSHVLGRGASLQCNDKRISRNHATIEITPNNVTLTSTHVNPCFLRAAESKAIRILKKDTSQQLNDGDTFALLPDDFWFRIKICENASSESNNETCRVTMKRSSLESDDAPPDKKIKTECDNSVTNNIDTVNTTVEETTTKPDEGENGVKLESKQEVDDSLSVEQEIDENKCAGDDYVPKSQVEVPEVDNNSPQNGPQQDQGDNANADKDDENKPSANKGDGNPGTSAPKPRREKCWYGAQCYRKNSVHRQDFTHPGDSDFESDSDDSRPSCSYGANCYRKNKDHRREYKHPPQQPPSKKKRTRKKVDRLNVADSEEMREFDDSEDPFINDDESDEYTGGSDEEDSDWEDSQEADEDGENVKRLVKEANRFVKK